MVHVRLTPIRKPGIYCISLAQKLKPKPEYLTTLSLENWDNGQTQKHGRDSKIQVSRQGRGHLQARPSSFRGYDQTARKGHRACDSDDALGRPQVYTHPGLRRARGVSAVLRLGVWGPGRWWQPGAEGLTS
jgi:hypothetical protein